MRGFLLAGVCAVVSSSQLLAASGDIYNLGTIGGTGTYSYGLAINASGQVAGASDSTAGEHAFRYDGTPGAGGVMRDLGTLGAQPSRAFGINASGQVAGTSDTTIGGLPQHAFRYTGTPGSGGAMADLGTLGGTHSFGFGINASGQVAGDSYITGDGARHAFRTAPNAASIPITDELGTLPGGLESSGYAMNVSGQVAGTGFTTTGIHAFRYDGTPGAGGVMHDLLTLGGTDSEGFAINDSGQVTGYSGTSGGADHAFRYTGTPGSGGAMADLGTLGGTHSYGQAINASGQVVGYSFVTLDNAIHTFFYTGTPGVDGVMIDLDTWLDATNPIEGAKWTLTEARGLTDARLITGIGSYDPDGAGGVAAADRAFLLDASAIPEPTSLAFTCLGGIALLRRRR